MHENEKRARFTTVGEQIERLTPPGRVLTDGERRKLEALDQEHEALFQELRALPQRPATIRPEPETRISVNEPDLYSEHSEHSYFSDLFRMVVRRDFGAEERIRRQQSYEQRDLTRVDTSSVGEFVPPAWLVDQYQPGIRASQRVVANLCRQMPLPGGTDSLNIPRISTNAVVAAQTSDNATVSEVDTVSATVTAPVQTFAGQNDVAIQVMEQSPLAGGFDQLMFSELSADLDRYIDVQVINGSGSNGQVSGILSAVASANKVAYTDATPTLIELWPSFGKVLSLVAKSRLLGVEGLVMHPRRWYWLASTLDQSNRAYMVPESAGPNNAAGTISVGGAASGAVGQILGVPVYIDANIPVTLTNGAGSSGTEDIIVAGRFSDAILWESTLRTRVLPDVLSGTLTVRLQLYEYVAFTAARTNGVSYGTIYDTGMASVAGF